MVKVLIVEMVFFGRKLLSQRLNFVLPPTFTPFKTLKIMQVSVNICTLLKATAIKTAPIKIEVQQFSTHQLLK